MYTVNVYRFAYGRFGDINIKENLQECLLSLSHRIEKRYGKKLDLLAIHSSIQQLGRPLTYGELYSIIMDSLYLKPGQTIWIEKNQLLWREIPIFLKELPSGRAIMLLRDPRAVLTSFKKFTYAPRPLYLESVFNSFDCLSRCQDYTQTLSPSKFMYLRFEDLLKNPLAELNRISSFLGLSPFNESQLENPSFRDAYGKPWVANSSHQSPARLDMFDQQKAACGWKSKITSAERTLTEHVCGPLMRHFGYPTPRSTNPSDFDSLLTDPVIRSHYENWAEKSEGIQQFPYNPLDPSTWRN
jgi:hypothetical protein